MTTSMILRLAAAALLMGHSICGWSQAQKLSNPDGANRFRADGRPDAAPIAIVGGTLIDGTGRGPMPNSVIVIEKGRLKEIGTTARIPPTATRIEAAGKYIVPGLMDANVHLFLQITLDGLAKYEGHFEALIAEAAKVTLRNGVTTVFDSWGPREALIHVRDSINSGAAVGSRIYLAGNIIGLNGPISPDFYPEAVGIGNKNFEDRINGLWEQGVGRRLMALTPEGVAAAVRDYGKRDVDFLKYASSSHGPADQFIEFSPEVQRIIVDEGHWSGLTVQAHTTSVESLRLAVQAGVDIVQHCGETGTVGIPDSTIRLMIRNRTACTVSLPSERAQSDPSPVAAEGISVINSNYRRLLQAKVPLLLATDGSAFGTDQTTHPSWREYFKNKADEKNIQWLLGEGHLFWLRKMEAMGMEPMQILLAATSNIAKAYRLDGEIGTIEMGKVADVVVLDKNPLASADHYRCVAQVIKAGQIVDRGALPVNEVYSKDGVPVGGCPR